MGRKKFSHATETYSGDIPETLDELMFYGLELDEDQIKFRDAIWDKEKLIIACNSAAGTGKTSIAVGVANLLVKYGRYDGVVYVVFPTQETKQGYLPGTQEDKTAPYTQPLMDALVTIGEDPIRSIRSSDNLQGIKDGTAFIDVCADTFMRGINLEHKVVILDEAQNGYGDTLKKVLTRIHDSSKAIIIGHSGQCDIIKHPERSGFLQYLKAFERSNDNRIAICNLTINHRGFISTFCDNVKFDWEK